MLEDTIAAISTPIGEGGLGIVRISGPRALFIGNKIFTKKVSRLPSHTIHHGHIIDPRSKERIDEVMLSIFKKPRSFTAEDMIEISGHGGIVPLRKILEACLTNGARLAEPGEFTKRAFLNERIDLAQAEAVVDIIRAKTEMGLTVALHQLDGELSSKIESLRQELINLSAHLEAAIDFPEEDIERLESPQMLLRTRKVLKGIRKLLEGAEGGKILREGIKTVIIGRPNVGKSSLLNALLKEKRAIVTPIPGTTRDIIEEIINVGGIPLKIIDTAGLTTAKGIVEKESVARTRRSLKTADLVLLVMDAATHLSKEDHKIMGDVKDKKVIVVINKTDLPEVIEANEIKKILHDKRVLKVSATKKTGLKRLEKMIIDLIFEGGVTPSDRTLVTNIRHKDALERTRKSLENMIESIKKDMSAEFISVDLKAALNSLGEITGKTVTEDILDEIFSRFCIGK
ncbi:tRNA uridine-5-carboxymethylaminomethyl(34) synthesis GTPase MnmE [bacterium]|nr:tRNA uridine-5-carboxymethylaminomethyl(34) synthesis GTPase MnmE [bacterium]